jgi:hypothetical protein
MDDGVSAGLPPLRTLERALRNVTERLSLELLPASGPPPRWTELEWRLAPAVAAMHGVSPLLSTCCAGDRPREWREFLGAQRAVSTARHRRILAELERLDAQARRAGLGMMRLKGAALDALGLYAEGERPMADIDLLVRSADLDQAGRLIESLGYRACGTTWRHRAFEPAAPDGNCARPRCALGERADNPIKIDLHSRIVERLPLREHDFTDLLVPERLEPGLTGYRSRAALLLHILAHTAGAMVHRGARLLQLVDIMRLASRMASTDWEELLRAHGSARRLWWAAAPLILSRRYLPVALPEAVLDGLSGDCPRPLRRVARRRTLTDFSYSHPRIDPAPGMVWARTATDLGRYLASRVRPSPAQRAQFEVIARTEPWASQPRWYAQAHWRRILEWATSPATRIETMQPVRAALALPRAP